MTPGQQRTDLAGMRIQGLTGDTVYMVDPEGVLQPISNPIIFQRIFRNWDGIFRTDIRGMAIGFGPGIGLGGEYGEQYLIKGHTATIYFVIGGTLRPITEAAFNKFNFNWNNVITNQRYVDSFPKGALWH